MGKIAGQTVIYNIGTATGIRERKTLNWNLLNAAKEIDILSYPARVEGVE